MHTVVETPSYLAAAKAAGISDAELDKIAVAIANDPTLGDLIVGTGGVRKVRFGGRGEGKSGGYRVITFYAAADIPIFLLTVFGKGERDNLTKAERNALGALLKTLVAEYRAKVVTIGARR